MNLSFNLPNKLWWITNFLDYPTYKNIHNAIIKERKLLNLESSKNNWQDILIKNIEPPLIKQIINYPHFEKLKTLVKFNPYFKPETELKNMSTTIHYMKKGAGINWHDDGDWKYGVTYYVNHKWNNQWGGELMFSNEDGSGFIPYVGNSLLIIKSPLLHKVVPVTTSIFPRISVQMFMK